ncbi:MAG: efflux RND transporter periplasmic adaptor subunit [Elusimicrobiales bacterium]|nr:efflux RND transporter periplasmic adaptor subunit [Elusimicrobiales bacterium]
MRYKFLKRKKTIIAIIVLVIIIGSVHSCKKMIIARELSKIAELMPVKVAKGRFVIKTQAIGRVEPENRVAVAPVVNGRMEEVLVKEGDIIKKGQVLAWMSSNERAALLDSLKIKNSTPQDRKRIEEAYNMVPVIAAIDGMIIKRAIEPGQSVSPSKEVFVISDRLIIKTFVDEIDIGSVKRGQKVEFYLDAFPEDKHIGKVLSLAHESTIKEGVTVYEVKILPRKRISVFRSGMTTDVLIITNVKNSALYLPKKAISYRDGDAFVTMKSEDGKKIMEKNISIGVTNEKRMEIIGGILENDTIYYSTGIAKETLNIQISN